MAMAIARGVIVTSGISVGQACEPGFTSVTRAIAHNGRWSSHIPNGPRIAAAAESRASSQMRRDVPCHSSARKYARARNRNGSAV